MALRQEQPIVTGMLDQTSAGFHKPLLQAGFRAPSALVIGSASHPQESLMFGGPVLRQADPGRFPLWAAKQSAEAEIGAITNHPRQVVYHNWARGSDRPWSKLGTSLLLGLRAGHSRLCIPPSTYGPVGVANGFVAPKTSPLSLVSPEARLLAVESNAIVQASALIAGATPRPFLRLPSLATLTSEVSPCLPVVDRLEGIGHVVDPLLPSSAEDR